GGTLTVNGYIAASGETWQSNAASPGAGAGGSIWITAASVAGTTGKIQAVGGHSLWGDGNDNNGGAGSGGRIAVYADSITLPEDNFDAYGGAGWSEGESGGDAAPGTIYLAVDGQRPKLIIDNDAVRSNVRITMLPDSVLIPGDVYVRDRARLGVERGYESVYWPIAGDLSIEPGCDIWAAGRGYWADQGPGAGQWGFNWGGGGGHGGKGGDGRSDDPYALGGMPYGSDLMPTTRGSGGATDPNTGAGSGGGGGALWIRVEGELSLRGNSEAGGFGGGANEAGGGAGGSILIEAGSVTGIATVRANGGAGNSVGGGGGGGRIAVYSCDVDPRIAFQVAGGGSSGGGAGAPGTLVQQGVAIGSDPQDAEANIGSEVTFHAEALGVGLTMRWQKDGIPLSDGDTPHGSAIAGSGTSLLTISNVRPEDFGAYRLAITNGCGQALSAPGMLSGVCAADFNNDGVVDTRDFVAFLNAWVAGDARADIDENGTVDSRDVIMFLNLWRAGC
ncbi:MAG TPA: GC-type dockerin domain-anchored protein, partial [Phycisphaerales bacterium]|nr:GC-type dockerin domain-anchored protein [Phycisphaerales bacterium]